MKKFIVIILIVVAFITGCNNGKNEGAEKWFKGNTHAHSTVSDGDSSPDTVAKWYHDHGYNFLVLTDHNKFVDPNTITIPENKRKNFILIGGEEVSGNQTIHTTAMNITKAIPWDFGNTEKKQIIQAHADAIITEGGSAILNHPNFHYAVTANDILDVKNLYMFELFNGHPAVHNHGDESHSSTEELWDELLTTGMKIYAVSSDDSHHFKELFNIDRSNPGRGWIMVKSKNLESNSITNAMLNGDFYATSGIYLKTYSRYSNRYQIEIDDKKTRQSLSDQYMNGNQVENCHSSFCNDESNYKIEFITNGGKVIKTVVGEKGSYDLKDLHTSYTYIRAKITFSQVHSEGGYEEYYAWGQPIFK